MAEKRSKQTVILNVIHNAKNGTPSLEICERAIDEYLKEEFSGLNEYETLVKIKTLLNKG